MLYIDVDVNVAFSVPEDVRQTESLAQVLTELLPVINISESHSE